jgi:hypothetical protein
VTVKYIGQTGYRPNWINATKSVEWNVAEFEFPNIDGTLVSKSRKRGNRYDTELYFQGENHLDICSAFERSASVSGRYWVVSHPLYGQLNIQMPSIKIDNTQMNLSKVTGTMIETIVEDFPRIFLDPKDEVLAQKVNTDTVFANSMDSTPSASDANSLTSTSDAIYKRGSQIVPDKENGEDYFNLYNKANSSILNLTAEPILAMRQIQAMVNLPSQFEVSVKNRLDTLVSQFQSTRKNVGQLKTPAAKKIYQILGSAVVSAMCTTSVQPKAGNYNNQQSVYNAITIIVNNYNTYIADLDDLQTDTNGTTSSFVPDYYSQRELNKLVNFTISNLFTVALGAKQERSYICEQDTNIILLTHRFLGLDLDDINIDTMMEINNIGLNEILNIRKGREIIYYV